MKTLLSISFCLILVTITMAQQDSVYTTVETANTEELWRNHNYQYFDYNLLESRTMFKSNFIFSREGFFRTPESLSVEQKIWPSLSVELGLLTTEDRDNGIFGQLRYYYAKRKGAKDSREKVNNFSGNYVAIGAIRGFENDEPDLCACGWTDEYIYNISFGRQQRSEERWYHDVGIGIQYFPERDMISVGFDFQAGLNFVMSRDAGHEQSKYEDFRANYSSQSTMIALTDPSFYLWNSSTGSSLGATLSLTVEQQVWQDLTLVTKVGLNASKQEHGQETTPDGLPQIDQITTFSANLSLQPRYYYNRKDLLKMGFNLRSFSGEYVAAVVNSLYVVGRQEVTYDNEIDRENITGFDHLEWGVVWGMQQRFSKRGFMDAHFGLVYSVEDRSFVGMRILDDVNIYLGATVGLALGQQD